MLKVIENNLKFKYHETRLAIQPNYDNNCDYGTVIEGTFSINSRMVDRCDSGLNQIEMIKNDINRIVYGEVVDMLLDLTRDILLDNTCNYFDIKDLTLHRIHDIVNTIKQK